MTPLEELAFLKVRQAMGINVRTKVRTLRKRRYLPVRLQDMLTLTRCRLWQIDFYAGISSCKPLQWLQPGDPITMDKDN